MRTASATIPNKATKIATAKSGVGSKRSTEENPSFDQILQKRKPLPKEEPARAASTETKKSERTDKRPAATKLRTKKPVEETDPTNAPIRAETVEQKETAPTATVDTASETEAESSDAMVEAVQTDKPAGDLAPVEKPIVNVGFAVGVSADVTLGTPKAIDDFEASNEVVHPETKPISASEPPPPVLRAPVLEATENESPELEDEPAATATTSNLDLPVTEDLNAGDDQPTESLELVANVPNKSPTKGSQPAEPEIAKAEPLGAKPVDQDATSENEGSSSDQGERSSNIKYAATDPEKAESSDDSAARFSFQSSNSAPVQNADHGARDPDASIVNVMKPAPAPQAQPIAPPPPSPVPSSEHTFTADNHANIVTSVKTSLLPNGGTMQIRLNPPELGAIQVAVQMRDGVMNASFETTSDQATRLLSHSLGDLRATLESSGIAVDKLHVEQSPRNQQSQNQSNEDRQQQGQTQDSPGRREQERRELLARMWRKLSEGSDPLDMVA